jgi:hypothetical protein
MNTTLASPDIKKMVAACLKNDRQAQIRLYELYVKQMYNTSLRNCSRFHAGRGCFAGILLKAFVR